MNNQGPYRETTMTTSEYKDPLSRLQKFIIAMVVTLVAVAGLSIRSCSKNQFTVQQRLANAEEANRKMIQRAYGRATDATYCNYGGPNDPCNKAFDDHGIVCTSIWPWSGGHRIFCCDSDRAASNGGCYQVR